MILGTALLPLIDVLTEVGFASAYPQLLALHGTSLRASAIVAAGPLAAVTTGWMWGRIVRRRGLACGVRLAVVGWSAAMLLMVAGLDSFVVMMIARTLQGGFAAGFAAIPFIAATRSDRGGDDRSLCSRRMSRIEVAASVGAILGPVTVGSGMVLAPRITLGVVALVPVCLLPALRRRLDATVTLGAATASGPRTPPTAGDQHNSEEQIRGRLHRVVRPVLYAAMVGLLLSAFELLVPTVIEAHTSRPLLGKIAAMAFESAVVIGVMVKARLVGLFRWLPLLTAAMIALGFVAASNLAVLVVLLLGVGLGIGAQVSMGNELAALSVRGFETAGMGAYATLRITGSFAGPMFLTIPFPLLLAVLAAVALMAVIPLSRSV